MSQIPECVAIGCVDIAAGMVLSVKTADPQPQEELDLVSAATVDLFQGANTTTIENMFKRARGINVDTQHYFQEIVVSSENLLYMFLRCKKNINHVLVFICLKSANLGMVISKSRTALSSVDATI
jgi:hypothetical protein